MILAAYMVAGFLDRLRVRRRDAARPARPLSPARLPDPVHRGRDRDAVQLLVGDTAARAIAKDQPVKFAAMEYVQTDADARARVDRRHLPRRQGLGRDRASRASTRSSWASRTDTKVTGWNTVPAKDRPPVADAAAPGVRRDGRASAPRCCCWRVVGVLVVAKTRHARRPRGSCGPARSPASLAVVGAGVRLDRHRGRPPALDRLQAAAHRGCGDRRARASGSRSRSCWCSTRRSGVGDRRRAARDGAAVARPGDGRATSRVPYGPAAGAEARRDALTSSRSCCGSASPPTPCFGGRRLRRRVLGSRGRRRGARRAAAGADRPRDRPGLGGQPRLADLHPRRPLDGVPAGLLGDLLDALRPAGAGRARASCCAAPASPSATSAPRLEAAARRSAPRSRISSVLTPFFMGTVVGAIASGRVPAGRQRRPAHELVQRHVDRRRRSCSSPPAPTWPRRSWSATPAEPATPSSSATSAAGRSAPGSSRAPWPRPGSSSCTRTRATCTTGSPSDGLPLVIVSALCGHRGARRAGARRAPSGRGRSPSPPSSRSYGGGGWPSTPTCCRPR